MYIVFIIILILIFLEIIFIKRGEYRTQSYRYNPYIDADELIEIRIVDPYLKEKTFFVNYKYSKYFEERNPVCVTFIKIPIFSRKPRIIDLYVQNKKVNVE